MAEKDSKQKNNGKKSQQKDDPKQRGTREESSQQKNQILNPPGPRSMGNAGQWMDNQLTKLRQKYGKIVGDLTAENKFARPKPAPIDHEALSTENDPLGIKRALVIKEHEIYLKKLDEDEDKYAQMYSILWGACVVGKSFIIETDHNNLRWMEASEVPKIVRWRIYLQSFDFKIRHIRGSMNTVADALSRLFLLQQLETHEPSYEQRQSTVS